MEQIEKLRKLRIKRLTISHFALVVLSVTSHCFSHSSGTLASLLRNTVQSVSAFPYLCLELLGKHDKRQEHDIAGTPSDRMQL